MNKKILREKISEVIAEMCFVYETAEPEKYEAKYKFVAFADESEFELKIYYPHNIALQLTSNFLGLDEDEVDIEDITDALKEILNMILGKFVAERYENHKQLLPIPVCKVVKEEEIKATEDNFIMFYEDNPVLVCFRKKE